MKKLVAATTVAASMAVGGLAGAVLGVPGVAGAAETAAGAVSWVDDALAGLVDDNTITQAQADAVEEALAEARPARGFHQFGHRFGLDAAADALGMTEDAVRDALQSGQTLADLAGEKGLSVDALVDALVADHEARLAEEVAEGDLTQEQADERLATVEERVTAMVNGERPEPPMFGRRGDGGTGAGFRMGRGMGGGGWAA